MRLLILEEFETGKHFKEKVDKECGFKIGDIYWTFIKGFYIPNKVIKIITKKEVKKVNKMKYFELKVVKVKKEECKHDEVIWAKRNFKCKCCGRNLKIQTYTNIVSDRKWTFIKDEEQSKGNWVNGENIDKIKFPVPISYKEYEETSKHYGMLGNDYSRDKDMEIYYIMRIDSQANKKSSDYRYSLRYTNESLKDLVEIYDIHILKGKIIIYEEEE